MTDEWDWECEGDSLVGDGEECSSVDEDGWTSAQALVCAYNPPPIRWCDSVFRTQLNVTTAFTMLKNYSIGEFGRLGVTYGRSDIENVLRTVNQIWRPASINFQLASYKEFVGRNRYVINDDEIWRDSYDSVMNPFDHWDYDVQVNIFVVPYITNHINGSTMSFGPVGVGMQSIVHMSQHSPEEVTSLPVETFGSTLAHELGHVLGLEHHPREDHLMYHTDVNDQNLLSEAEITYARQNAAVLNTPRLNGYVPGSMNPTAAVRSVIADKEAGQKLSSVEFARSHPNFKIWNDLR
jgi:Metallo-peptidase family M12B Reprolysin-like